MSKLALTPTPKTAATARLLPVLRPCASGLAARTIPRMATDVVVVSSHDLDFGELQALATVGRAQRLGERWAPDGSLRVAYRVGGGTGADIGPRRNPSVRIGREFFTTALKDYADWQEKWWREALQNAIDAGATEVLCETATQAGGILVSVEDNGSGMDLDILLNKFLVLGGSGKSTTPGSVGGFGKAKELLILPWLQWWVHTRNVIVEGSGIDYEVREGQPWLQGTRLSVLMPLDQTTTVAHALNFIKKCDVPGVRWHVRASDGGRVTEEHTPQADLHCGDMVRDFGTAELCANRTAPIRGDKMIVRVRGRAGSVFMYDTWVSEGIGAVPILEITGRSVDLLTANRDGIRDFDLRRASRPLRL